MAHQITITLSDQEYATLSAEAARNGIPLDALLYKAIVPHMKDERSIQSRESSLKALYQRGIIMNIATREPLTAEEDSTLQQLAPKLGVGQPLSEIVIEDRGPRD
jgi:hypothetical protein